MTEGAWQAALEAHLNRPGSGIRVWRQQAGVLKVRQNGVVRAIHCAPAGAADLTGIAPGGRHLELEAKVRAPWTSSQRAWARAIERAGGLYVLARFDARRALPDNLSQIERAILGGGGRSAA